MSAVRNEIFLTGGAGFVGRNVTQILLEEGHLVHCYDVLDPKVVNPSVIGQMSKNSRFSFTQGNILNRQELVHAMHHADAVVHCAAISGVDRSIKNPGEALEVNVVGTFNVVDAAREVGVNRVHFVSTDEVFGHATEGSFHEGSPSAPRNPYAAGKLGGEGFVRAYGETFGMDTTITNCVNNYGSHQAPDKLIPRLTIRGLQGRTLPIYGDGRQVREWIDVRDHATAITHVLEHGRKNERYCVGTGETHQNMEVICTIGRRLGLKDSDLEYVPDRRGHDIRYSVDARKICALGWSPKHCFSESLEETIDWYADNRDWWKYYLPLYPDLQPI